MKTDSKTIEALAGQAATLAQELQRLAAFVRTAERKANPVYRVADALNARGEGEAFTKEMTLGPSCIWQSAHRAAEQWEILREDGAWLCKLFPEGIEGDADPVSIVRLNLPTDDACDAARVVAVFFLTVNR